MANIKIIRAGALHAEIVSAIGRQAFFDSFGRLFRSRRELHEYLDYTFDPVKILKSLKKEINVYLLAFLGTAPIGFAKVKTSSLNEQIESISQTELQKLYVLSKYHGQGAGSALMQSVLDLANSISSDYLWLDTHISNQKGIQFYERNGFGKIGRHYFVIGSQTFEYYVMSAPLSTQQTSMPKSAELKRDGICRAMDNKLPGTIWNFSS